METLNDKWESFRMSVLKNHDDKCEEMGILRKLFFTGGLSVFAILDHAARSGNETAMIEQIEELQKEFDAWHVSLHLRTYAERIIGAWSR